MVECYSGIYDSEMSISTVPTNHPTKVIANNKANVDEMNRVLIGFKVIPTYRISFKLAVQRIQKLAKHRWYADFTLYILLRIAFNHYVTMVLAIL